MAATTSLEAEFLQDHRVLTQGLRALRDALETGDRERVRKIAADLDREAGPHIEFEERHFYPWLMPLLGADFVRDLYREHDAGKSALRDILRHEDLALDDVRVLPLISDVEIATEHALSCGTLISHLQVLTDAERDQMRDRLLACRARGTHWTAISTRDRPVR